MEDRLSWQTQFMGHELNLELFRGSLGVNDDFIALSELGSLLPKMSPAGFRILDTKQLFFAPGTWTLPSLSLKDFFILCKMKLTDHRKRTRLLCYDLRAG